MSVNAIIHLAFVAILRRPAQRNGICQYHGNFAWK